MRTAVLKTNSVLKQINYYYIVIVVFSLMAHGLLLLNDGVYWDGWLIYTNLIEKDWDNLYIMYKELGAPQITYIHWVLGHFPGVIFGYKFLAFVSITLSGILVYTICDESSLISRSQGFFIAVLSLSYPAFQVSIELIMIPFLVCYCLFLLACFLAIKSEKRDGISHYGLRLWSLALFVFSFTINSLLVFYFGFLVIAVILALRKRPQTFDARLFAKLLMRRLDYVLLPFLYWAVTRTFFPFHDVYVNYNKVFLSLPRIVGVYTRFFWNAIYYPFEEAFSNLVNYPVFGLIALAIVAVLCVYPSSSRGLPYHVETRAKPLAPLLLGLMLLFLGIFPYAAVGKHPSVHEWGSRNALLIGLPMAIICVAGARLIGFKIHALVRHLGFGKNLDLSLRLEVSLIAILMLAFSASTVKNYVCWQARWVKDRSIILKLSETPNRVRQFSTYWVEDKFRIGYQRIYRFYEWSSIFKTITGEESRVGLDRRNRYNKDFLTGARWKRYFTKRYNLSEFDPTGPQAVLRITRGPNAGSDGQMAITYLLYKFLFKNRLIDFLKGVTELQIKPV